MLILAQNLALATFMVCSTVVVHFVGLMLLTWLLRRRGHHFRAHESLIGQGGLLVVVVLGLVAIHSVQIWLYALLYMALGVLTDVESALYFSTVSFSSLGYGDITLPVSWRLIGAIEGINGLLLIAWSTAFLLSVTMRLRTLEHDWLERR